eukprot:Hpha_TRINITY_DN15679_c3_g3::TRINITY_DN15679_c3_g3_i1::g.97369::m.97369
MVGSESEKSPFEAPFEAPFEDAEAAMSGPVSDSRGGTDYRRESSKVPNASSFTVGRVTHIPRRVPSRKTRSASKAGSPGVGKALTVRPSSKRVSLAAGNMVGYLVSMGLDRPSHRQWITDDVEQWCAAVAASGGVVDIISGDRRYATFNARRQCHRHACAAVEVLSSRGRLEEFESWTGCVVSGPAVCGSFGCAETMRFMVLGAVAASLHPFERLAARWVTRVLTDV